MDLNAEVTPNTASCNVVSFSSKSLLSSSPAATGPASPATRTQVNPALDLISTRKCASYLADRSQYSQRHRRQRKRRLQACLRDNTPMPGNAAADRLIKELHSKFMGAVASRTACITSVTRCCAKVSLIKFEPCYGIRRNRNVSRAMPHLRQASAVVKKGLSRWVSTPGVQLNSSTACRLANTQLPVSLD